MQEKRSIVKALWADVQELERNEEVLNLFNQVWIKTRNDVIYLLNKSKRKADKIFNKFDTFLLSLNPFIRWQYRTEDHGMEFNLLSLFYRPTYEIAGALVHEATHVEFLKEYGMLGASEHEHELFAQKHKRDSEIKALTEELSFLIKIREFISQTIHMVITEQYYGTHKIDEDIEFKEQIIQSLKINEPSAKSYEEQALRSHFRDHQKMSSFLGLKIDEKLPEESYRRVKFSFTGFSKRERFSILSSILVF